MTNELAQDSVPTWSPLKKALWHVVTSEKLNDGHYVNAYELTDKLYVAALAAPANSSEAPMTNKAIEALRLYDIYDRMPSDRGGKDGPRGKAYQAFVEAKGAALASVGEQRSETICPDCQRHVMSEPQPAFGFIATCGRRLTRVEECSDSACTTPPAPVSEPRVKPDDIVDALFADLRDRSFLKWLFDAQGEANFIGMLDNERLTGLDLDVQADIRAAWAKIIEAALVSEPTAAPEGWVLVPREPTEAMIKAGAKGRQNSARSSFSDGWRLALTALPSAPKQGGASS